MDLVDYKKVFEDSVDGLVKLLQIPSVYDEPTVCESMPYGQGVYDALCYMKELALKDGFDVVEYDNHAIAIRYRQSSKRVDIVSHLDVVEPGNNWSYDPFAATIDDGKLYARGTQDMKTSAWLSYLALKLMRELHPEIDCEVRIVLGCDEERTMNDMRYYVEKAGKPDFAFTPDGYFPMGIGEKGALMWRLKGEYHGLVEKLVGGVQCNVIAPSAYAIVSDCGYQERIENYLVASGIQGEVKVENDKLRIDVVGKAAHCSRPDDGYNATCDLLEVLGYCLEDEWFQQMASCFYSPYGLGCDLDVEIEPMGKLTMNLGVLRMENGTVYGEVDSRYPYGITSQELTNRLQASCPCLISLDYDDIPTLCQMDDLYVQAMLKTYRDLTQDNSEPMISGGVSYSKVFEHCVSFGLGRIGEPMLAHQANEYIELEKIPMYLQIYYEAILAIAKV